MARIQLDAIWIHPVTDYTQGIAFAGHQIPSGADEVQGEVRSYGGGRRRAVSTPGVTRTRAYTLTVIPRTDVATLLSWEGQIVMVRDLKGERLFGTFFVANIKNYGHGKTEQEVSIDFTEVTFQEAT